MKKKMRDCKYLKEKRHLGRSRHKWEENNKILEK